MVKYKLGLLLAIVMLLSIAGVVLAQSYGEFYDVDATGRPGYVYVEWKMLPDERLEDFTVQRFEQGEWVDKAVVEADDPYTGDGEYAERVASIPWVIYWWRVEARNEDNFRWWSPVQIAGATGKVFIVR